jgi:hypothetical protein
MYIVKNVYQIHHLWWQKIGMVYDSQVLHPSGLQHSRGRCYSFKPGALLLDVGYDGYL